ncbi:MAG TPA: SpaH/EbpB family LPXTG-anchored major pilin [Actinomycetaceae bacterium]|nr:SpaH/EbpB family LPXTG-anchored major pilin [Actinomycetaceae bacterium]
MLGNAVRRIAAGVGAVALAMAGTLAMGTAASADVGPDQPDAPETGSLTIVKKVGDPETGTPGATVLLDGVEFTVTTVGRMVEDSFVALDPANKADWELIEAFENLPVGSSLPDGLVLSTDSADIRKGVTGSAGQLEGQYVFSNLPLGLYYVQETGRGDNLIVAPVDPFYVSIPTSNGDEAEGWNYDIVAEPKNRLAEDISKIITARPDALAIGSEVTWEITVPVPENPTDEWFVYAAVTDELDSRLDYHSSTLTLDGTALVAETHYKVIEDEAANSVTWQFTAAGLEELDDAAGKNLLVSFKTTVTSVGDGEIINQGDDEFPGEYDYWFDFRATKDQKDPEDDPDDPTSGGPEDPGGTTEVPGKESPRTFWGQLKITKVDDSDEPLNLSGAEFKVFEKGEDDCAANAPAADAVATGTSDANGVVQWASVTPTNPLGLWVGNWNASDGDEPTSKDYCVYETVVPAGHTATELAGTVTIVPGGLAAGGTIVVTNYRTEGPDLPMTGAQGTMLMTVGGLLLVGAGTGAIAVSRRKRSKAAAV